METITHSNSVPPYGHDDMLSTVAKALILPDQALTFARLPEAAVLGECDYCDPTGLPGVAVATVTWTNHLDRPVTRKFCRLCTSEALLQATSDGYDVTVHATIGSAAVGGAA